MSPAILKRRTLLKCLIAAAPAVLVALALCLASEQLRVQHILAELYLFWGYLNAAAICALAAWVLLAARRKIAGLGVLLVLTAAFLWSWQWDVPRNAGPATGAPLKVISYNWLADSHDRDPAYDWIRAQDPDILLLAEFGAWMPGVKDRLYAQFPYRSQPAGDVILLSKYPIVHQKITHFGNRAALLAQLDVKGRLLTVYGIHPWTLRTLDELAMRDAYLADLADSLSPKAPPLIMLGDFNATRWEPALREVIRRGDLHEEPRLVPLATRMGVRSKLPFIGSPIDHIFTNGRNHLSGCHTGPALGSDHLPLVCDFRFAG
jgi:endonuclease/exonuclease/phosphatase (EEP) superfamily protein YafD